MSTPPQRIETVWEDVESARSITAWFCFWHPIRTVRMLRRVIAQAEKERNCWQVRRDGTVEPMA